jgi:hypothetical protein
MGAPILYCQGDLLSFNFSLRAQDACVAGKQNPWPIPAGSIVTVRLPGTSAAVVLSSATAVPSEFGGSFEVTVLNATDGDCSATLIPTKGAGALLSTFDTKGNPLPQTFNIVVFDSSMSQIQTFQVTGSVSAGTGITVYARAVA